MFSQLSSTQKHMDTLARLLFQGYSGDFCSPNRNLQSVVAEYEYLISLTDEERAKFVHVADIHHVTIRAFQVVEQAAANRANAAIAEWCRNVISGERARIVLAVKSLASVCSALEEAGARVAVIKSLDHWPDLGSDLDLYTTGDSSTVIRVMTEVFHAKLEARSWGDKLANKWNFNLPGLPEFVEIHVRYLGQTGEHSALAHRVVDRRSPRMIEGYTFQIPAPEERIIISTLQRMYRHFYFRLCDMADFAVLLQKDRVDFAELKSASLAAGIWSGVAAFLLLVSKYVETFGGNAPVPREVLASAYRQDLSVRLGGEFLRVPKGPAAALYVSQFLTAVRKVDRRAMCRLPLLPPLAISALLAFKLTGSDKGVW